MKVENLIRYPYYETTVTKNGITFTDNGDGTVTANGTATANSNFYCSDWRSDFTLEKGTYTVNGGYSSKSSVRVFSFDDENGTNGTLIANDIGEGATFTLNEKKYIRVYVQIVAGATVSTLTFEPMLVKGHVSCPYVPYNLGKEKLREDINTINNSLTEHKTVKEAIVNSDFFASGVCSFNGTPILTKDGNVKFLRLNFSVSTTIAKNTWYDFCMIDNEDFIPIYGYQQILTLYSGVDAAVRYNHETNKFQFYSYADIVPNAYYCMAITYIYI